MDRGGVARAEKRFGNRLLQIERTRDADVFVWLSRCRRLALRRADAAAIPASPRRDPSLRRHRANTALFTLANALLLRDLRRDPQSC
jgi:hypothetical protein